MENFKSFIICGLTALAGFVAAAAPVRGQAQPPTLTPLVIRVVTEDGIAVERVAAARKAAGYIFAKAGLEAVWTDCPPPCPEPDEPSALRLQILSRRLKGLHADAAGFARVMRRTEAPGLYAVASYAVATEAAANLKADVSLVLGAAIAHEIGHLMLGPAHSHDGVMSARIGFDEIRMAERGMFLFNQADAVRLRAEATRRAAGKASAR